MPATVPRYTVDDLQHFPDDGNRYELVDGFLLVTPGPGMPHQRISVRIASTLWVAIEQPGFGCIAASGTVTRPPYTELQPDILVWPAAYGDVSKWQDVGEHWLAVEILSRGSRIYDREIKRAAYLALGVREVWLVDPRERHVEIYRQEEPVAIVPDRFVWSVPEIGLALEIDVPGLFPNTR